MLAALFTIALAAPPEVVIVPTDDAMVRELAEQATELITGYARQSKAAYIGRISAVVPHRSDHVAHDEARLEVETVLRGRERDVVTIRVPAPRDPDDDGAEGAEPLPVLEGSGYAPPAIVDQRVLVFVDRQGWILEGNALYAMGGPLAWRSVDPDRFMRPDMDRDWWDELTPGPEWIRLELAEVEAAFQTQPKRRWWR